MPESVLEIHSCFHLRQLWTVRSVNPRTSLLFDGGNKDLGRSVLGGRQWRGVQASAIAWRPSSRAPREPRSPAVLAASSLQRYVRCLVTGWGRATARGCGGWMRTAARSLPSLTDIATSRLLWGQGWVLPVPGGLPSYPMLPEARCSRRLRGCCGALRLPWGWRRVNRAFKN